MRGIKPCLQFRAHRRERKLESFFDEVELGAMFTCTDCMPYENDKSIWIVRGLRMPMKDFWPLLRKFI